VRVFHGGQVSRVWHCRGPLVRPDYELPTGNATGTGCDADLKQDCEALHNRALETNRNRPDGHVAGGWRGRRNVR